MTQPTFVPADHPRGADGQFPRSGDVAIHQAEAGIVGEQAGIAARREAALEQRPRLRHVAPLDRSQRAQPLGLGRTVPGDEVQRDPGHPAQQRRFG